MSLSSSAPYSKSCPAYIPKPVLGSDDGAIQMPQSRMTGATGGVVVVVPPVEEATVEVLPSVETCNSSCDESPVASPARPLPRL